MKIEIEFASLQGVISLETVKYDATNNKCIRYKIIKMLAHINTISNTEPAENELPVELEKDKHYVIIGYREDYKVTTLYINNAEFDKFKGVELGIDDYNNILIGDSNDTFPKNKEYDENAKRRTIWFPKF